MFEHIINAGAKLLGGFIEGNRQDANAERNIQLQRDFAQQGIRWKVADAKAAGVHPLYALGANTTSFAPVSVGSTGMGSALASMGQDVGRAINATQTAPERVSAYSEAASKLQLDNMALQNQLLASRVRLLTQAGGNPPLPTSGNLPPIPEDAKQDPRPPIQMGGERWNTDPGTTNMQKIEDRYGDESAASHLMSMGVLANDMYRNYGQPSEWPQRALVALWNRLSNEVKDEYGNFQRFVSKLKMRSSAAGGGGW